MTNIYNWPILFDKLKIWEETHFCAFCADFILVTRWVCNRQRSLLISDLVEFSETRENRGEADAKSLQTLIKLLHRGFRGTRERTLVHLFHFLMLSIRPNVLLFKLQCFSQEIYSSPFVKHMCNFAKFQRKVNNLKHVSCLKHTTEHQ